MKHRIISVILACCFMVSVLQNFVVTAYGMGKSGQQNTISAGSMHTAAIKADGTLWSWGSNVSGETGNSIGNNSEFPVKIIDGVASVSAGEWYTAVVKTDGTLWTWGAGYYGQLGKGTIEDSEVPIEVMEGVAAVSTGELHMAALRIDGTLWTWGLNANGQLGNGTTEDSLVPVKVMDDVAAVSAGNWHTAAIKTDGTLWTWGRDARDYLGYGVMDSSATPIKVMEDITAVSAGGYHTAAIKMDGTLWTWGDDFSGQLGNGPAEDSWGPAKVMDDVVAVTAGDCHTAAIKKDGTLWTWGDNESGQLGNGTTENSAVPIKVMDGVVAVSSGSFHTAALRTDGTLWTWGRNDSGQLGNGTTENSLVPVKVLENVALPNSALATTSSAPTLPDAVRYVPYSAVLPAGTLVSGSLPAWLNADGGILSGIPTEAGSYTISLTDRTQTTEVILTVLENGDTSVSASVPEGYMIEERMPDIREAGEYTLVIEETLSVQGAADIFDRLLDVYMDGRKLKGGKLDPGQSPERDWEYYATRGSARITLAEQYTAELGNGTHTISVAFASAQNPGKTEAVSQNVTSSTEAPEPEFAQKFSDARNVQYRGAVWYLTQQGIIDGYEDGLFHPERSLTRAQACKLIMLLMGGSDNSAASPFTDTADHWAEQFIRFCAGKGIVGGYGNGVFGPDDEVTGYAWAKMLLCANGFDEEGNGLTGTDWENGTRKLLMAQGMDLNMSNFQPQASVTREEACQMAFNIFF